MNSDLSSLHNYIAAHRQAGATDEAIYQSLVAAGWPADLLHAAFTDVQPTTQLPQYLQEPASPIQTPDGKGIFHGRLGRLGYLMALVYVFGCFIAIVALSLLGEGRTLFNVLALGLGLLGGLTAIPLAIALHIRRWHDLDQSGWLTLLVLVPVAGFITSLILLFVPGTPGPNRYGQKPSKSLAFKSVFNLSR